MAIFHKNHFRSSRYQRFLKIKECEIECETLHISFQYWTNFFSPSIHLKCFYKLRFFGVLIWREYFFQLRERCKKKLGFFFSSQSRFLFLTGRERKKFQNLVFFYPKSRKLLAIHQATPSLLHVPETTWLDRTVVDSPQKTCSRIVPQHPPSTWIIASIIFEKTEARDVCAFE